MQDAVDAYQDSLDVTEKLSLMEGRNSTRRQRDLSKALTDILGTIGHPLVSRPQQDAWMHTLCQIDKALIEVIVLQCGPCVMLLTMCLSNYPLSRAAYFRPETSQQRPVLQYQRKRSITIVSKLSHRGPALVKSQSALLLSRQHALSQVWNPDHTDLSLWAIILVTLVRP